ncbi:hypothetical protein ACFYM2_21120 [Streptomyces sp. NPDC006711]|uniref:hypothetical protein n=1 Tax=Streptomyces sp. NPDC006711 TaxID=3364762 RepID=UPI0036C80ECE
MTIPASSAPAVRQYLFDQLSATLTSDPDFPNEQLLVCFDEPGTFQPADIVSIGKVSRQDNVSSMVGSGGPGWLEETYDVDVTIDVYRGGDYPQHVFARSVALFDAVCVVVRSDPTLGGAVLSARPTASSHEVAWDDEHKGRHCITPMQISCYQRI